MKLVGALVIFLACTTAAAQNYFRKFIDFRDSVNSEFLHDVEDLGAILLHGYLAGEVQAYNFDIHSEDVKWKPFPADQLPDAWDPKLDYFVEDWVLYKGKAYVADYDIKKGTVPEKSEQWRSIELHGEAVSTLHRFPGAKDSLTRADLLRNFIADEGGLYMGDPWSDEYDYYTGDICMFNDRFYECLVDHKAQRPDIGLDFWQPIEPKISFFHPRDLGAVGIVYSQDREGEQLVPQTLSVFVNDYNTGVWKGCGLNFYYQDAVDYLARLKRIPLLYRSTVGYAGTPQLLLGEENTTTFLTFLQDQIKANVIEPGKQDIPDPAGFELFMQAPRQDFSSGPWSAVQDMTTNDLVIGKLDFTQGKTVYMRALHVSWKSLEVALKAKHKSPKLFDYLEGIESNMFNIQFFDTLGFDSLRARAHTRVSPPANAGVHFIDRRYASTDSNSGTARAMTTLWSAIKKGVEANLLTPVQSRNLLFPCDQVLPDITFTIGSTPWTLKGFSLQPTEVVTIDELGTSQPVIGVVVEYKRTVAAPNQKSAQPEPLKVGVRLFYPDLDTVFDYDFLWKDVQKLVGTLDDLRPLTDAMINGRLNFDTSVVVYGPVADR